MPNIKASKHQNPPSIGQYNVRKHPSPPTVGEYSAKERGAKFNSKTKEMLFGHKSHSRGFPQSKHQLLWKWGSQFFNYVMPMCVHLLHIRLLWPTMKPSIYTQDPATSMDITKKNLDSEISPEGKKKRKLCIVIKSYGVWINCLGFHS